MTQTIQSAPRAHTPPTRRASTRLPPTPERAAQWARGLGWFSVGLGLTELLASRPLARAVGLRHGSTLLPWLGMRELMSGVGILAQKGESSAWMQTRVLGDAIDLGVIGAAMASPENNRTKLSVAAAAVLGVTALDVACSTGRTGAALKPRARHITRSISILRPVAELYEFWRKLDNLPRVMSHLQSVEQREGGMSHWVAKAPAGVNVEWDAKIVEDTDRRLSWRSIEPADIAHRGEVRFVDLGESRGTLVTVQLDYDLPVGPLGAKLLAALGQTPEQQIATDLRRWKQLMETGEIATTEGQSSGHRTWVGRTLP